LPIQEKNYGAPIYWRRSVISAITNGFGEEEALKKIFYTFPICQEIAY
jgi:hypothetical protein